MKQEIELKYQLASEADFRRFMVTLKKQAAGQVTILNQRNIFFDTPTLDLQNKGLSLRLRRQNGLYFLCAKQSTKKNLGQDNLSVRLECEAELDTRRARLLEEQLLSALEVFADFPVAKENLLTRSKLSQSLADAASLGLQIIGSFSNRRTKIPMSLDGRPIFFELDHAIYPDRTHIFEVEIEFCSELEASLLRPIIEALLKQIGLKTRPSMAKSTRLYAMLFGRKALD